MVKTQQARDIYSELTLDKSVDIPRDFKQIQNFKYNESKKIRHSIKKLRTMLLTFKLALGWIVPDTIVFSAIYNVNLMIYVVRK